MVSATQSKTLEILVRESCNTGDMRYMAWVSGYHQLFALGRSPLEAIGALVDGNKDLFDISRINWKL